MSRVIAVQPVLSSRDKELLAKHGELVVLEETTGLPEKPSQWDANYSEWLALALKANGYTHGRDVIALAGNYLALAQLIAVLVSQEPVDEPFEVHCLAYFNRNGGEFKRHTFTGLGTEKVNLHDKQTGPTELR